MSNPLLETHPLPLFSHILPEHVLPAVESLIHANETKLHHLLHTQGPYTWDNLLQPLADMNAQLQEAWSVIAHLHAVTSNESLRQAYSAALPKVTSYYLSLSQNQALYAACQEIQANAEYPLLGVAKQENLRQMLRDFELTGVALPPAKQAEFARIQSELATQQTRYEEHVLDATDAWSQHIEDVGLLVGMPDQAIATAAKTALERGSAGYILTLQAPCYSAVMTYADNRELRQTMYAAFITRASELGPASGKYDNSSTLYGILANRHALARLLDYANFADYSLATRMAKTVPEVLQFLEKLATASLPIAQREFQELREFAKDAPADFAPWDIAYYSEKMRQKLYDIDGESLRPYFPLPSVLHGLFYIAHRLYGVNFQEKTAVDVWHTDVRCYELRSEMGILVGEFYLDLYARPHKRGGAWMDGCRTRRRDAQDKLHTPIAFLTCNFSAPQAGLPSLLTHDEVLTLFHEFGHGLHHLLTHMEVMGVSGINGVPWDAVEFPSQFFEHWCWEKIALSEFAKHYQTQEALPMDVLDKLMKARHFHSAMQLVRQLEFAIFDFRIHAEFDPQKGYGQIQAILDEVRAKVGVVPVVPFNRFQHSFNHIFSGGYAAGYYGYKWAEVLSCDAYTQFERQGPLDERTGRAFLNAILIQGGSQDPMALFMEFMGRHPSINALLRHNGIVSPELSG